MLRKLPASSFLRVLTPTTRILGVVKAPRSSTDSCSNHGSEIGLSVSDPYLSFAKPLVTRSGFKFGRKEDTATLFDDFDIGGILIGRAMTGLLVHTDEKTIERDQEELYESLTKFIGGIEMTIPCTVTCIDANVDYIKKQLHENLLWDSLKDVDADSAAYQSAVAMQVWLDEHCGGWQNTFG